MKKREDNVILDKSYKFSLRVVNLYKFLTEQKKEYVLSKQILRSGTAIGANTEEAAGGQSDKDFVSKFSIAYKEARETSFWIRLLRDSKYITDQQADSLLNDCEEICKIIAKIQITMKSKICNNSAS